MRKLVFLFIFDFIGMKANINSPRQGLLSSLTFQVKCLDCAINGLIHTFSGSALVSSQASSFGLCQMACVFKATTNPH